MPSSKRGVGDGHGVVEPRCTRLFPLLAHRHSKVYAWQVGFALGDVTRLLYGNIVW
jgi:hypothetical protein